MSYIRQIFIANQINDLAVFFIWWEDVFPYGGVLLRRSSTFSHDMKSVTRDAKPQVGFQLMATASPAHSL
jgi:hypothetical protein